MKQVGLSASETSIIYGVMPFLSFLTRPLFGAFADRLQQHKLILMMCCVMTGIFHACLLFIPHSSPKPHPSLHFICSENGAELQLCKRAHQDAFNCSSSENLTSTDLSLMEFCSMSCTADKAHQNLSICIEQQEVECMPFVEESQISTINISKTYLEKQLDVCSIGNSTASFSSANNFLTCSHSCELRCTFQCPSEFPEQMRNQMCFKTKERKLEQFSLVFFMFFTIYLFAQIAFSPIVNLIDAMTYDYLGDDRDKWGRQRLWGTVGFALFAVISTLYMDVFGSKERKDYTAAFILFAINNLVASGCVCMFKISQEVHTSNMLGNLISILKVPELALLLTVVFIYGAFQGLLETFVFWHLQNLGSSQLLLGLSLMMNCIPEILVLSVSGKILKCLGHVVTISIIFVTYFVRFFAYSFLVNPWYVLCIEPLHSITFGLMYAEASSFGSRMAPAGMHGTIQGLISGLHFGFGKIFKVSQA